MEVNMRLVDLMTPHVITAQASQTVAEAHGLLRLYRIEHLPVLAGAELRGIVTEQDLIRAALGSEAATMISLDDLLCGAGRRRVVTASPLATVEEARTLLDGWPSGYLLVRNSAGEILGIVTATDLADLAPSRHSQMAGRNAPRIATDLEVREFVTDEPASLRFCNLSTGGALVTSAGEAPPAGEVVALEWTLPDDEDPLWAAGRVVRQSAWGDTAPHAVEFVALSSGDQARIARYVRSQACLFDAAT
jgi:CBS domain-containing protein